MKGTRNNRETVRSYTTDDFRQLRKAMGWKWEDINEITGLAIARTGMTRGLPAWTNLALEVERRAEQQLRLGVVDAVVQRLGTDWIGTPTPENGVAFRWLGEMIELSFGPGTFTLRGRCQRALGLVDQLELVYGKPTRKQRPRQSTYNLMPEQREWLVQLDAVLSGGAIF